jgi:hypothetical protein
MRCLFLCLTLTAVGAQFAGQKVDGRRHRSFARSLDTGKYYPANMTFEQDHATANLESGKIVDLILDDPTIEDPEEIAATDPRGTIRPNDFETLIIAGAAAFFRRTSG